MAGTIPGGNAKALRTAVCFPGRFNAEYYASIWLKNVHVEEAIVQLNKVFGSIGGIATPFPRLPNSSVNIDSEKSGMKQI